MNVNVPVNVIPGFPVGTASARTWTALASASACRGWDPGRALIVGMGRIWHMAALGAALGVLPGAALGAAAALLPRDGEVASGVRCAGQPVGSGAPAREVARDAVARALGRRVVFTHGDQPVLSATLAELGAEADPELLARQLESVARGPTVWARLDEALEARRGRVQLAPRVGLPVDDVAARPGAPQGRAGHAGSRRAPRPGDPHGIRRATRPLPGRLRRPGRARRCAGAGR